MTEDSPPSTALAASGWLSLAATPTFAVMALATGVTDGSMGGLCAVQPPFNGMVAMYALMAVFHAAPWIRLAARARAPV
ncbi:MAG: hypothetical protein J7515_19070 [Caulobacter sp.]|nr:hypothetical protein [Caulobacter sp.]